MTKKTYLLIAFLLIGTFAFGQLAVEKTESIVYQNGIRYSVKYSVTNTTKDTFYLWILNPTDTIGGRMSFRKYFHPNLNFGTLAFLCWDGNIHNIDEFIPEIGFNFIKRLCPNEIFFIFVPEKEKSVLIAYETVKNIRKMVSVDALERFSYRRDFVLINYEE